MPKIGTAFVGRIDGGPVNGPGSKTVLEFPTQDVAEGWVSAISKVYPDDVKNGIYYVDVVTEDSIG